MPEPVVWASGLSKRYRVGGTTVHALLDISLLIEPGEFVCIAGRSGSGKSTLISILGLLDRPDIGLYLLAGLSLGVSTRTLSLRSGAARLGSSFRRRHSYLAALQSRMWRYHWSMPVWDEPNGAAEQLPHWTWLACHIGKTTGRISFPAVSSSASQSLARLSMIHL